MDDLEDIVGALRDQLDALHAKIDEAVAQVESRVEAAASDMETRIAGELASVTARIHDQLVEPHLVADGEAASEITEPVADPVGAIDVVSAESPQTAGGWHPAQP